jgi:serine/threonine-protein kinase RsbW
LRRLTLQIQSNLGDVSLVGVAINAICVHLGLNSDQASSVELCIVEALTNVIRHSYLSEPDHTISVEVSSNPSRIRFDLLDSGKSMSLIHAARLKYGATQTEVESIDPAELAEGGRGLQIIHELMDEVQYTPSATQNRLTLVKRL